MVIKINLVGATTSTLGVGADPLPPELDNGPKGTKMKWCKM